MRNILVVTNVKSNHAHFQRFWPIDEGSESFEIRQPTVQSNFSVESKKPIAQQDLPKLEKYDALEFRL